MFTAKFQPMNRLLLVLICLVGSLNICFVHTETIDTWGELYNVRAVDHRTAVASGFVFKIQNRTLVFPPVDEYDSIIGAIQHINYHRKPVQTKIVSGGVGSKYVVFTILSQRSYGISSTVTVFTKLDN